jgi:TPR repeat protein
LVAGFLALAAAPAALAQGFEPNSPTPFGQPALNTFTAPPSKGDRDLLPPSAIPDVPTATKDPNADLAFGAYQRGFYGTAMREAMKRLATNKNDGPAMTLAGELYAQGLGVKPDETEATRWYKLAAEAGDPPAMFEYGLALMKGTGVAQDRAAAKHWFEAAASHDHSGALFNLGLIALRNNGEVQDYKTAARYFTRAASLQNPEAEYALALMYRNGEGIEADATKAAALMKQAADADNIAAMVEYGIMLFNGIGGPIDEAGAAHYFLKAANRNNPIAQNRAARLLVVGRGVKQDVIEGMKWHLLARSAGLKDAWLDGQLNLLTAWQRTAVDNAVKAYVGS